MPANDPKPGRPAFLDLDTGMLVHHHTAPQNSLAISPAYKTVDEVRSSFSKAALEDMLSAFSGATQLPGFESELQQVAKNFTKNIPLSVAEKLKGMPLFEEAQRAMLQDHARLGYAEALDSSVFRNAAQLQLGYAGTTYFLANYTADGPNVLLAQQDATGQDKVIIWTLGFMGELMVGILSLMGIKVKGGNKVTKVIEKLWDNINVRELLKKILAGLSAAGLLAFLKMLYDEGLLGEVLLELADVSFWGILSLLAALALNLVPGAGQVRLLAGLGLLAIELGVKLANKPEMTPATGVSGASQPSTAGNNCCCCVSAVSIQTLRDLTTPGVIGHAFDFVIDMDYKGGGSTQDCILQWWEKITYKVPGQPDQVEDWFDQYQRNPGGGTFRFWRELPRPCPNGGHLTIPCPDTPCITLFDNNGNNRTVTRITEFRLVVRSNASCSCSHSSLEAKAIQTLSVVNGVEVPGSRSFKLLP